MLLWYDSLLIIRCFAPASLIYRKPFCSRRYTIDGVCDRVTTAPFHAN